MNNRTTRQTAFSCLLANQLLSGDESITDAAFYSSPVIPVDSDERVSATFTAFLLPQPDPVLLTV